MKPHLTIVVEDKKKLVFDKPGKYVVYFENITTDIACQITVPDVSLYLFGLYTMKKKETFRLTTSQIHSAPHSFSQLTVVSVADGTSSLAFSGLIHIEKQAQQSHAYQKNQNLIISPQAFVDTRPMLEIEANDVFCTHGSTTGSYNEEQIRYMMMRGLSRHEAEYIYREGFKEQLYLQMEALGVKRP